MKKPIGRAIQMLPLKHLAALFVRPKLLAQPGHACSSSAETAGCQRPPPPGWRVSPHVRDPVSTVHSRGKAFGKGCQPAQRPTSIAFLRLGALVPKKTEISHSAPDQARRPSRETNREGRGGIRLRARSAALHSRALAATRDSKGPSREADRPRRRRAIWCSLSG